MLACGNCVHLQAFLALLLRLAMWVHSSALSPQKVKDPEKAAELRGQLQRLDQRLAADRAAQRKAQLVGGIKVRSFAMP